MRDATERKVVSSLFANSEGPWTKTGHRHQIPDTRPHWAWELIENRALRIVAENTI